MTWSTADLLDEHAHASVMEPGLHRFGSIASVFGQAVVVVAPADNTHVRATLETPGLGRMLVVDGESVLTCALVGDRLAQLAIDNSWAGVIVNGCIRDSAVIAEMEVGVWALGTCPRRSEKLDRGGVVPRATFLGVTINEGDWVYADSDGVLVAASPLHK